MLPAPLVRARVRGDTIRALRAERDDPLVVELAEHVHRAFSEGAREHARLGDVLAELDELVAEAPDAKLARGLVRVAEQQCETGASAVEDPAAFRSAVFRRAVERGPLGLDGPVTATTVLAEIGSERGLEPERCADDLYADLPLERRVVGYGLAGPERLLDRYDVSNVQSLLVSANEIRVVLRGASMPRMRQLVRWIKFFRLLHQAALDGEELTLTLDGPMSLFGPSSRYGLSLASFFPSLLLQECPWTLSARVAWKRGAARELVVTSDDRYVGHFSDTGSYRTKVHEHFAARFAETARDFALEEGKLPIRIADRDLVFPDYTLVHPSGRQVHLEILGHWRPERLMQRLDALSNAKRTDLILAVGRKLTASNVRSVPEHPQVVPYSEVLSVERVLTAARRAISARGGSDAGAPLA